MPRTSFRVNQHTIVCQNVNEFLARRRRQIWTLNDSNGIWIHHYLVGKRTLNHLIGCILIHRMYIDSSIYTEVPILYKYSWIIIIIIIIIDQMIEQCCKYLSLLCIFMYLFIMSRASFRVNPQSIVCLNVKDILVRSRRHISSLIDSNGIGTHNHLIFKWTFNYLAKLANWLSWVVSTYPD